MLYLFLFEIGLSLFVSRGFDIGTGSKYFKCSGFKTGPFQFSSSFYFLGPNIILKNNFFNFHFFLLFYQNVKKLLDFLIIIVNDIMMISNAFQN